MKNIDKINEFINEMKDEDLDEGSVFVIAIKPVERNGDTERSMMNCVAKGSLNALKQGLASAMLNDAEIRRLITDAGMLAAMQHIEREEFVDSVLKKIK